MKCVMVFLQSRRPGCLLALSTLAVTIFATQVGAQSIPSMPMVSINDYHMMRNGAEIGDRPSATGLFYYLAGLRVSLMSFDDAHVGTGAKRRICISPTAETGDLIDAIDEELARNTA